MSDVLTELFYGETRLCENYTENDSDMKQFERELKEQKTVLLETMGKAEEAFSAYEAAKFKVEDRARELAFASGFKTAVQLIAAGLSD